MIDNRNAIYSTQSEHEYYRWKHDLEKPIDLKCPAPHPEHYTIGQIEPWDFIIDQEMDFLEGNIIKYVARHREKGGLKDLQKAKNYLDKLIETEYNVSKENK